MIRFLIHRKGVMFRVLFPAVFFLLSATLQAQPTDQPVVRAGDKVRLTVWRSPEMSGEFIVDQDGAIQHPLLHDIRVGGLTFPAAQQVVATKLAEYEAHPQFLLQPLFRVVVTGEVKQPNILYLPGGTSVAEAVALAGGPTDRGRLDRIHVFRHGTDTVLDLSGPRAQVVDFALLSGDQIQVDRRRDVLRDVVLPSATLVTMVGTLANLFIR
jgi:polysaccharide export outer membrane protein